MLRFIRALALAMVGFGAAAGSTILAEVVQSPARAQTVQAEGNRDAKSAKSARRGAKDKAADAETDEKTVDAEAVLDKARRALADGKAETAFGLADSVIKNAKKDPRNTARALAVRGEAHLHKGRPAEALADLDSALWVKGGLAGTERDGAARARAQALQQSGLAASADAAVASTSPRRVSSSGNSGAESSSSVSQPSASESSSSGIGSFFSSIFGGGSKASSNADSAGRAPVTTATNTPARPVEPSLSSSEPQRTEQAAPVKPRAEASAPNKPGRAATAVAVPSAPSALPTVGGYRIQLAAVRSRPEAEAMAQNVRKDQAAALGRRSFEVIEEVYGNMGRFYRVRIGMFEHPTEALAICSALRQKQLDCMLLEH